MRTNTIIKTVALSLAIVFLTGIYGFAADIKARMKSRLPVIISLKEKGIVGENYNGFLEFRGANREKEDVVNAENVDRKKVYAAIAKQQGVSAEIVGQRRAAQIAQKASAGEWLQDANGNWYQK